jgi:hypothetical protein
MCLHRRHHRPLLNHSGRPVLGLGLIIALSLVALAACAEPVVPPPTATLGPTATFTPTATPAPTWTPTPTPTATPIPPARLEVQRPEVTTPLNPVPVEALLEPPPGMDLQARVSATVMDPEAQVYATFELTAREGDRYRAPDALVLPLDPLPGYWWLIVHVDAPVPVIGDPALFFEIPSVAYRDLSESLPVGVTMHVPEDFAEVAAWGDTWAGGRVWAYRYGEVALWWVPGPTKAFFASNALVVLEATYTEDTRWEMMPALSEALPTEWQGRPGFEFPEVWPGVDGGLGRAWVIQDTNYWLYVLRVRGVATEQLPVLHEEIAKTFSFVEASD